MVLVKTGRTPVLFVFQKSFNNSPLDVKVCCKKAWQG